MVVLIISDYYSKNMGYSENMLPKYLSKLQLKVYVLSSEYNVYGNSELYKDIYEKFLGNAKQTLGITKVGRYILIRAASAHIYKYLYIKNLYKYLMAIKPDVVHCTEIGSINFLIVFALKPFFKYRIFTESHQHYSVVAGYLKGDQFSLKDALKKLFFIVTKKIPIAIASSKTEVCYAISEDCRMVASKLYGVDNSRIQILPLGCDVDLFGASSPQYDEVRIAYRLKMGYKQSDIVCIYTGRLSDDKNPLLLGQAIESLAINNSNFHALFIGEGPQKAPLSALKNCKVLDFLPHSELRNYYFCADLGVWPRQESMSMIDAMASGMPILVSNEMGDKSRVICTDQLFSPNDSLSLAEAIKRFADMGFRHSIGRSSANLVVNRFNWLDIAAKIKMDYLKN